jgi:hypothetical protein
MLHYFTRTIQRLKPDTPLEPLPKQPSATIGALASDFLCRVKKSRALNKRRQIKSSLLHLNIIELTELRQFRFLRLNSLL